MTRSGDRSSGEAATGSSKSRLDEAFASAVRDRRVPGITALALNKDGSMIYQGAWGNVDINDPSSAQVTPKTKMRIASMTKAITVTAALQLVEQGKLSLDDPVEKHLPKFASIQVLDGFDANGHPVLRAPKTKATILHLLTHTSGQPYEFINEKFARWGKWSRKQPRPRPPVPLVADPGTGWFYGTGTDALGQVIEAVSGQRLNEYFDEHIFKPLGIKNSGILTPDIHSHRRRPDGTITAEAPIPRKSSEVPFGGGFLTSTLEDYATFLLAIVNYGTHPQSGVTILKPSTVRDYMFTDLFGRATQHAALGSEPLGVWTSTQLSYTNSYTFLPGVRKGWTASFLMNVDDIPGRRRGGAGAWAGINNLYYWVDPKAGVVGIVFTNLMPFLDAEVLRLFDMLEEEVYAGREPRTRAKSVL